jgi:hypothetical protein
VTMSIKGGPSDWWERLGILSRRIGFEPLKITFDRPPPRHSAIFSSPLSPASPRGGSLRTNFEASAGTAVDEGSTVKRSPQEWLGRGVGGGLRGTVGVEEGEGGGGGRKGEEGGGGGGRIGGEGDLGGGTAGATTTRTGQLSGTVPPQLPGPGVRLLSFSSPVYAPGPADGIYSEGRGGGVGIVFSSPGKKEALRIGRIGGDDEEKATVYFGRNCLDAAFGRWCCAVDEYKEESLRMRDYLR